MRLEPIALRQAAESLFRDMGPVDDLGPELSNTIANVYYKFYLFSGNLDDPLNALGVRAENHKSAFKAFFEESSHILPSFKYAGQLVEQMRHVRDRDKRPDLFDYLRILTLDILKYRLDGDKTPIRRALERRFHRPNEIEGLYEEMVGIAATARVAGADATAAEAADTGDDQDAPDLTFVASLPDHDSSPPLMMTDLKPGLIAYYYEHPETIGAKHGLPSIYRYPQVAVIMEGDKPLLIVRVESSVGAAMICALTPDGAHHNFGHFGGGGEELFMHHVEGIFAALIARG